MSFNIRHLEDRYPSAGAKGSFRWSRYCGVDFIHWSLWTTKRGKERRVEFRISLTELRSTQFPDTRLSWKLSDMRRILK